MVKMDWLLNLSRKGIPDTRSDSGDYLNGAIGRKFDKGKQRWDLLPMDAVSGIVDVLTYGARKYDDDNWKNVSDGERRYHAAAMRHIAKHIKGELFDDETGYYHLDHAMCNLIFWRWFVERRLKEEKSIAGSE